MISKVSARRDELSAPCALEELDAATLRNLVQSIGLDQATLLLYQSICESSQYGPAIDSINRMRDMDTSDDGNTRMLIVPGFLHQEFPESGADGRLVIDAAKQIGLDYEILPSPSTGRLVDNAKLLLNYLETHSDSRLVLASICKGGSEVVAAMQLEPTCEQFSNVVGWVNVCGVVRGSPVVDRVSKQRLRMLGLRFFFALRRWTMASLLDLRYEGGMLEAGFKPPSHMNIVHAVGFPTEEDFTLAKLRSFHHQIGDLGPNDGVILLHDALRAAGVVYPVLGADHYMRPRFRVQPLCRGLLRYAMGHQPAGEAR